MVCRILLAALVAQRRHEPDEQLPLPRLRSPGPKRIPQKVEAILRIGASPVGILAVNNLRLLRMQF